MKLSKKIKKGLKNLLGGGQEAPKQEAKKPKTNKAEAKPAVNKAEDKPKESKPKKSKKELEREERARKKEERGARIREGYVNKIASLTGWDKEYARAQMEKAKENCGISFEHYTAYHFYNIPEDKQKEYFTKGHADTLKERFNTDPELTKIIMNKVAFSQMFDKFLGRAWADNQTVTEEEFKEKFGDVGKIIYKPQRASGGKGIEVFKFDDSNIHEVYETVTKLPEGIIEQFVEQHPEMSKLSVNSVNTVRVVTIRTDKDIPGMEKDKVYFVYIAMRMGSGSSYTDNLHSGGLSAVVDKETGVLMTDGVDLHYNLCERHPDTGVKIKGFQIPEFDKIKEMITEAESMMYGYFGWDVAVTVNGPVIIECNTHPGSGILQSPYVQQQKGMKYVVDPFLIGTKWETKK